MSAGASPGGAGSRHRPFDSLAAVEAASAPGDTIVVQRSDPAAGPLDGGIALKPRQRLLGAGRRVTSRRPRPRSPLITNTDPAQHDGDAVVLANRTTVRNLRIADAQRGAVYGNNVTGVRVIGNDVTGHNGSCAEGFHIPPFVAATNVPGVGLPISEGLVNGWAAIMVDADHRRGSIKIARNRVHDAHCGDGIDVRLSGDARYRATLKGNKIHRLEQGSSFESLLAIGLQTRDHARLRAELDANAQTELGNPSEPNTLVFGADTEGVFVNPVGPSKIDATITGNTYTNPTGLGGFSGNGMEMVSMGDGSVGRLVIRDSTFAGSPGDVLEQGGLGTNALLELKLVDVVVAESSGFGNTGVLPFNNADCLLAGSLGAGNTIRLTMRRTTLANCANNGLSIGSNVVNGSGATKSIEARIEDSEIRGNRGANVAVRNFTALEDLRLMIEDTVLRDNHGGGSGFANFEAEELGATASSAIDLGGGSLGSHGGNCITGSTPAAAAIGFAVSAEGNWWGSPGGPAPGSTLGAALDHEPFLDAPPRGC